MIGSKWTVFLMILCVLPGFVLAQTNCLYVSTTNGFAPVISDPIVNQFTDWGYNLTYVTPADVAIMFPEEWEPYDFVFIDEIVGSASLEGIGLEGHPIPLVTTENYAPRANILGYCTNTQATNIAAEPVLIENGDHPLAAGFATGSEVTINTGGGANEDLIPNLPEIPFIGVAKPTTQHTDLYVAYGVEAGETTVNDVEIINRGAIVGFHANGYSAINDNGFLLLKAAIDWVTESGSAVEEDKAAPQGYRLAQNFPNPFNPETTIGFQLEKAGRTTVNIYNATGQLVTTLLDANMPSGYHEVTLNGQQLQSGIYFYQIQSGSFSAMEKMILMK